MIESLRSRLALLVLPVLFGLSGSSGEAPSLPSPQDGSTSAATSASDTVGGPGAALLFDKREREDLFRKYRDFRSARADLEKVQLVNGPGTNEFDRARRKVETAQKNLDRTLGSLGKKHEIDPLCLTAVADWAEVFTQILVDDAAYTSSDKVTGRDQQDSIRDEPKNSYTRRLPRGYDPKKKAWPLLLVVQDKERHSKLAIQEDLNAPLLLDGDKQTDGHVLLAIDLPAAAESNLDTLRRAFYLTLRDTRMVFNVNANRTAIGGIGSGAKHALTLVSREPKHFSAFVAKGGEPGSADAASLANIPVFLMGDVSAWTAWIEEAKAAGIDVTVKPEATADELAQWLATKERNPYAPKVRFSPPDVDARFAGSWLKIDPIPNKKGKIDVRVDAASNSIHVETEGISAYTLLLSDALVDLSKPISIHTNKGTPFQGKLPPSWGTFDTCLKETPPNGLGAIYTALHRVEVRDGAK